MIAQLSELPLVGCGSTIAGREPPAIAVHALVAGELVSHLQPVG